MRLVRLGVAARIMLTLPLIRLSLARGIRLRLRFAAERRIAPVIVLGVFPAVLARLAFGAEIRLALPKLLLGRGDQPEIMLGVLIVVFAATGSPDAWASRASWMYFSATWEAVPRTFTSGPFD